MSSLQTRAKRIFLLSPAKINGIRARLVTGENTRSHIAHRLRQEGVSLGELFTFLSGLYFRGKLEYARTFAAAPSNIPACMVITAGAGLVTPDRVVTLDLLQDMSLVALDPRDARYRDPLDRDARALLGSAGPDCQIVLLGSIATPKYVEPLTEIFGRQLVFPSEFIGRGDMSRGGLMLRCVQAGIPLTYIPVIGATCHGRKPPKLAPLPATKLPV